MNDGVQYVRVHVDHVPALDPAKLAHHSLPTSPTIYIYITHNGQELTKTPKHPNAHQSPADYSSAGRAATASLPAHASTTLALHLYAARRFRKDVLVGKTDVILANLIPGEDTLLPLHPVGSVVLRFELQEATMAPLDVDDLDAISTNDLLGSGGTGAPKEKPKKGGWKAEGRFSGKVDDLPAVLRDRIQQLFEYMSRGKEEVGVGDVESYFEWAKETYPDSTVYREMVDPSRAARAFMRTCGASVGVSLPRFLTVLSAQSFRASLDDTDVASGLARLSLFFPLPPPSLSPHIYTSLTTYYRSESVFLSVVMTASLHIFTYLHISLLTHLHISPSLHIFTHLISTYLEARVSFSPS